MKTFHAMLVALFLVASLIPKICMSAETERTLSPVSANQVLSVRIYGPPMRRYEPLLIGDAFGRDRINELYSFFSKLETLDAAKGIPRAERAKKNRVVLQLQSKVNDSFEFQLHVLEGDDAWICGDKCFSMKAGWKGFVAKEFARQEKDFDEHGYPKVIHVDEDNAAKLGFRVQIGGLGKGGYERFNWRQFSVYLKPELASKFEHSYLGYFQGDEVLLGAAAHSEQMDDGQLRLAFSVNPTIAADVGFRIQIAQKPRPFLYRFDLPSFLINDSRDDFEHLKGSSTE